MGEEGLALEAALSSAQAQGRAVSISLGGPVVNAAHRTCGYSVTSRARQYPSSASACSIMLALSHSRDSVLCGVLSPVWARDLSGAQHFLLLITTGFACRAVLYS